MRRGTVLSQPLFKAQLHACACVRAHVCVYTKVYIYVYIHTHTCTCVQVGTKRYDSTSGGEREIQRTMLELLNQLDGFDSRGDVKVLLATNRIETLDPALLRPGRIDRKIEFSMPDLNTKRRIFQIHTRYEKDLRRYVCHEPRAHAVCHSTHFCACYFSFVASFCVTECQ
jgi:hypothetical protein